MSHIILQTKITPLDWLDRFLEFKQENPLFTEIWQEQTEGNFLVTVFLNAETSYYIKVLFREDKTLCIQVETSSDPMNSTVGTQHISQLVQHLFQHDPDAVIVRHTLQSNKML